MEKCPVDVLRSIFVTFCDDLLYNKLSTPNCNVIIITMYVSKYLWDYSAFSYKRRGSFSHRESTIYQELINIGGRITVGGFFSG